MEIVREEANGRGRLLLDDDGNPIGTLSYRWADPQTLVIEHVGVDPKFRGRGHAQKLVEYAIEMAKETGSRIVPLCSYAAAYFQRHPEHKGVL